MVVLENLLKELKKIYIITKDSEHRAKLFAEPDTPVVQSPVASARIEKLFEEKDLQSRLGLFKEPETQPAQSPVASAHTKELFAEPETQPAKSPSPSPSTETLPSEKSLFTVRVSSR
jgi:hypothetical protein